MEYYGIANPRGGEPIVRLGEGLPDLLALGHRGGALPVFGTNDKLQAFIWAHPSLNANVYQSVDTTLLGANLFEVAELISPAVEAGRANLVVFDPVLDADGSWVSEAFKCPAEGFCAFMTVVIDIARRKEGIPADRQPSVQALRKALIWYMWRIVLYRLGLLQHLNRLRRHLGRRA